MWVGRGIAISQEVGHVGFDDHESEPERPQSDDLAVEPLSLVRERRGEISATLSFDARDAQERWRRIVALRERVSFRRDALGPRRRRLLTGVYQDVER